MAIELTMPALSPTMEKGTLAKWLVREGDRVKAGDLIAEIETDKATMEFEVAEDGCIAKLVIAEGADDVAVGSVIALLAGHDETVPELAMADAAPAVALAEAPAPASEPAPAPEPGATPPAAKLRRKRPSPEDRIKVSPLAARIADAKGIDLGGIAGTGPNGRIVRADLGITPLLAPQPTAMGAAPAAAAIIAPPPAGVPVETIKLSSMRKAIARRLTESKTSVPHFYLTARCNLDPLLAMRSQLNAALEGSGVKLSVNDLLIKALALALQDVPDANVQFGGDVLHRIARVDVSMAVAIDGGLVTPVLRDVGALSLSVIARQSKELATIMAATASFDHRAIDGAVAAEFIRAFHDIVENPMRLTL